MTDNEIIKALELCSVVPQQCSQCPYYGRKDCVADSAKDAIDLIRRQQETINELPKGSKDCKDCAGCTQWLCECANVRAEVCDRVVEQLEEMEKVHQKSLDKYYDNSSGYPCVYDIGDIKENIIATIKKVITIVKGVQNE